MKSVYIKSLSNFIQEGTFWYSMV